MIHAVVMGCVLVVGVSVGLALRRVQRTTSKWAWDPLLPYSGEGTIVLTFIFLVIFAVLAFR